MIAFWIHLLKTLYTHLTVGRSSLSWVFRSNVYWNSLPVKYYILHACQPSRRTIQGIFKTKFFSLASFFFCVQQKKGKASYWKKMWFFSVFERLLLVVQKMTANSSDRTRIPLRSWRSLAVAAILCRRGIGWSHQMVEVDLLCVFHEKIPGFNL